MSLQSEDPSQLQVTDDLTVGHPLIPFDALQIFGDLDTAKKLVTNAIWSNLFLAKLGHPEPQPMPTLNDVITSLCEHATKRGFTKGSVSTLPTELQNLICRIGITDCGDEVRQILDSQTRYVGSLFKPGETSSLRVPHDTLTYSNLCPLFGGIGTQKVSAVEDMETARAATQAKEQRDRNLFLGYWRKE